MSDSRDSAAAPRALARTPLPGIQQGELIAGKYRVERVIGRGGMGVVVAATHLQLGRTVAIKLLREEFVEDPSIVERLVREARAAASIQSEHVARVLDVGTFDSGAPFIVMEYLEGQDLDSLLQTDGPLQVIEAVDFMLQACEAIAEAHFNHIVHRDLKPANLFVARQPGGVRCVKVVDFGISKLMDLGAADSLTDPSRLMGSLYHMAPEQISGDPVDARTDVWALGVLLYEMLTGQKPFRPGAWPAVCHQIVNEPAPELEALGEDIPDELRAAIRRCLRRSPGERYANVAELAVEIMPHGSRRARHSLERIVRLATATGSLSADALGPATPQVTFRAPAASAGVAAPAAGLPAPSGGALPLSGVEPSAGQVELPLELDAERNGEGSHAPLSSERRPAPPARGQRQLLALGLLLGSALVVVLAVRLANSGRVIPSEGLQPLSPAKVSVEEGEVVPTRDPKPNDPPIAVVPPPEEPTGPKIGIINDPPPEPDPPEPQPPSTAAKPGEPAKKPAEPERRSEPEKPAGPEKRAEPVTGSADAPVASRPTPTPPAPPPSTPPPAVEPPSGGPQGSPVQTPPAADSPPSTAPRTDPGRDRLGDPFDLKDLRLPPPPPR